jgi:threonine/homoserine/homoserine lactone efflux protein
MADLASFIVASFVAGLSATIPPGTIFAMTVAESAEHGSKAGLLVVLGHAFVEVIVVIMLTMGLGLLLSSDASKMVVGLLGGVMLLWTGYDLIRGSYYKDVKLPGTEISGVDSGYGVKSPLVRGVMACIANPYFIIWWATVGGGLILRGSSILGWMAPLVFLVCHWASDFPWFAFISYTVDKGRGFFGEKGYTVLLGICGVSLGILGVIYLRDGLMIALKTLP